MRADLHVHSCYSDGNMTVEEILKYAESKNVDVIAITDHDNLDSNDDIHNLKGRTKILMGVELSTYHNNENIHILGYFYNNEIKTKEIIEFLSELKNSRDKRIYEIISKLETLCGIYIKYEDVAKFADGALGRVHVAKAIKEKYGCSIDDAFNRYIGNNAKAYVPTSNFLTKDAVNFLHRNNAIAIIAHPKHIKKNDVLDIVNLGVDGIEVYYPEHDSNDINRYLQIANTNNLLITGGSDFHGIGIREDLGMSTIKNEDVDKFLSKLNIK